MNVTSSWSVDPLKFMDTVKTDVSKKAIDLANQIFDGVVDKTPVWTGRARACWTLTPNAPVFKSIPLKDANPKSPMPPPVRPTIAGVGEFPRLFVCNGQPYSCYLEFGGPNNAPTAMVRTTLAGLR